MKWILVFIYIGGLGTPVSVKVDNFTSEKACREAAQDFVKKNPDKSITAVCDHRQPEAK